MSHADFPSKWVCLEYFFFKKGVNNIKTSVILGDFLTAQPHKTPEKKSPDNQMTQVRSLFLLLPQHPVSRWTLTQIRQNVSRSRLISMADAWDSYIYLHGYLILMVKVSNIYRSSPWILGLNIQGPRLWIFGSMVQLSIPGWIGRDNPDPEGLGLRKLVKNWGNLGAWYRHHETSWP